MSFLCVLVCCFFVLAFLPNYQELAQVQTPPNVKMIDTSPPHLAWLLAGVVYPADADDHPDLYVSDFVEAASSKLTARQMRPRTARLMAAKFIQKLLSKVRCGVCTVVEIYGWFGIGLGL